MPVWCEREEQQRDARAAGSADSEGCDGRMQKGFKQQSGRVAKVGMGGGGSDERGIVRMREGDQKRTSLRCLFGGWRARAGAEAGESERAQSGQARHAEWPKKEGRAGRSGRVSGAHSWTGAQQNRLLGSEG